MITGLDTVLTQAEFGDLVGIGQPAVSDLMTRKVIVDGQSAGQWLLAYCAQLREVAAGRGADGDLAYQRAELARVARERNEIQLAKDRKEFAAVSLLELVCAHIGRSVAGLLEPLPSEIHKLCPALTPDDVRRIQLTVSKACDVAVSASIAELDDPDSDSVDLAGSDSGLDLE